MQTTGVQNETIAQKVPKDRNKNNWDIIFMLIWVVLNYF